MTLSAQDLVGVSQLQAKELAGKEWRALGKTLRFASYDPRYPGEPPWKSGGEGIAYPLLDTDGRVAYYGKFFDGARLTPKRVQRAKWLAEQQLSHWAPQLLAAPITWVTGSPSTRPSSINFDFSCLLAAAAPGRAWQDIKADIVAGTLQWTDDLRMRAIRDFLAGLAELERRGFVHGDLSPGNLVLCVQSPSGKPVVYIIDFDAFVWPDAFELQSLSTAEGGTFGTPDYCPPDLVTSAATQAVTPYTDRFARDTLLVELLGFDRKCPRDESASKWDTVFRRQLLWNAPYASELPHLQLESLFELADNKRPSTRELADAIGVRVRPRVKKTVRFVNRHYQSVVLPAWILTLATRVQPLVTPLLAVLCLLHWSGAVALVAAQFVRSSLSPVILITWVACLLTIWLAGLVVIVRLVLGDMRRHQLEVGRYRLALPTWFPEKAPRTPRQVLVRLGLLLAGLATTILVLL